MSGKAEVHKSDLEDDGEDGEEEKFLPLPISTRTLTVGVVIAGVGVASVKLLSGDSGEEDEETGEEGEDSSEEGDGLNQDLKRLDEELQKLDERSSDEFSDDIEEPDEEESFERRQKNAVQEVHEEVSD